MVLKPFVRHKIKRRRRRKIFSYYIVSKNAFWVHIFEKNFAIVLPKANQARIEQFLEISHLESRIIRTKNDVDNLVPDIDYTNVRPYLDDFRKYSQRYIIQELKG